MKVAFDQQIFLLQRYGGISRYICSLAKELEQSVDTRARIFAPLHLNNNLLEIDGVPHTGIALPSLHPKLTRIATEVSKCLARSSMQSYKPDVVHETYFSEEDFRPHGAARVVTVYDMIYERFPDSFGETDPITRAKKLAVKRADHVICISKSTQRDLIELLDVPAEKTSVTYLSADPVFSQLPLNLQVASKANPYFLYVGNRSGYKNFSAMLRAFARSSLLSGPFGIVCFGGGQLSSDELAEASRLGLREEQLTQVNGDDQVLLSHYHGAIALMYPSAYEGFGIPPLEAMAAGCPVISSDASSLPEVVGSAGEYVNPSDEDSIRAALELVALSPDHRQRLIEKGAERHTQFSWKRCARETEAIYRRLL